MRNHQSVRKSAVIRLEDLPRRMAAKVVQDNGCWIWQGALNQKGYPMWNPPASIVSIVGNRTKRAHRIAYILLMGPVPDGLQLDHVCRDRRCINPQHLDPCTNRENRVRALLAAGHHTDGRLV